MPVQVPVAPDAEHENPPVQVLPPGGHRPGPRDEMNLREMPGPFVTAKFAPVRNGQCDPPRHLRSRTKLCRERHRAFPHRWLIARRQTIRFPVRVEGGGRDFGGVPHPDLPDELQSSWGWDREGACPLPPPTRGTMKGISHIQAGAMLNERFGIPLHSGGEDAQE